MLRYALLIPLALTFACKSDDDTDGTDDTDTDTDTDTEPGQTIVELAAATPRFSILVDAVTKAGLAGALDDVTVFAPNNDAFEALFDALGVDGVDDLSVDQLTPILTYHVVDGLVDAAAATGIAEGSGTAQSLGGTLNLTLSGSSLKVDDATVIGADILASNGIIHEINAVLVPDLVDVITTDASLSTLTSAVLAADGSSAMPDLVGTLSGAGPFTVLAPTNDAFATVLTENDLADLGALVTAVGIDTVIDILTYHVASGSFPSTTVVGVSSFSTLGGTVTVTLDGTNVILNDGLPGWVDGVNTATVTVVDILTSNGIIHKINKVITPSPT